MSNNDEIDGDGDGDRDSVPKENSITANSSFGASTMNGGLAKAINYMHIRHCMT